MQYDAGSSAGSYAIAGALPLNRRECLIQQTSLAPLVVQLKGVVYARAFGVNYVYLLWALVYETVFVVFVPVYLVELIYPNQNKELWVNNLGLLQPLCFSSSEVF